MGCLHTVVSGCWCGEVLERFADIEDVAAKVWVYVKLVRDLGAGVEHSGVVPASEEAADGSHLHVGLLT